MNDERVPGSGAQASPPERMFLTAQEVGHQLGIGRSRVYELAAAGLLPVVRLGKRMLFPRRGLDELAEEAITRVRAELMGTAGPRGLTPLPAGRPSRADRTPQSLRRSA